MKPLAGVLTAVVAFGVAGSACTPDVARDPTPQAMQFDPQSTPPRVPQPIGIIVNSQTGHIDFSLAGTPIPSDCTAPVGLSPAECEFDQYLQTLDGFPTVTPAEAPATAPLDPATLSLGSNVVVVAAKAGTPGTPVTNVIVGFDARTTSMSVRPLPSWTLGEAYWVGVRGYENGVRAADGAEVVGSPTLALLKQEQPLTCGASDPDHVDPTCPAVALLAQSQPAGEADPVGAAARTAFQLEAIRLGYVAGHGWDLMAAAGLPKKDLAALWSFPIHTSSVAELDPSVGLVPTVVAPDEIHVAVKGTVDPDTVTPFVFMVRFGSVVVIDLTAVQGPTLPDGFPVVDVSYAGGAIVIKGHAPFVVGHQYGVFFSNDIHDNRGNPLVPSPVSVLLKLRGSLLDRDGHSAISTVSDQDAAMLEVGRAQLGALFDGPLPLFTHVTREQLVYCFAFAFGAAP